MVLVDHSSKKRYLKEFNRIKLTRQIRENPEIDHVKG